MTSPNGDMPPDEAEVEDRFAELSALFEELRGLDAATRARRLEALRERDRELCEEVADLLAEHEAGGALASTMPTPRGSAGDPEGIEPGHPKVVGPYKILGILGEGGMGAVYAAEQTEPVRRRVAVKLIKLGMDSKQVLARFESERQALAMMNHDNIARIFDCRDDAKRGQPFFVMEHVQGHSAD